MGYLLISKESMKGSSLGAFFKRGTGDVDKVILLTSLLISSLILIFIFGKHSIREVKSEFNLYDKKRFILAAFCWALMLNTSIRAYQLGSVTIVAPLFALTAILNALVEFVFNHDKSKFVQKIVAAIIILIGVILIKM